jgi:hypothetical protein
MILLSQLALSDHLLGMKSKRRTISLADISVLIDFWMSASAMMHSSRNY